jgi:hypothetical protein
VGLGRGRESEREILSKLTLGKKASKASVLANSVAKLQLSPAFYSHNFLPTRLINPKSHLTLKTSRPLSFRETSPKIPKACNLESLP